MSLVADRVVETSQTTGTGTLDLDGASTGFRSFVVGIGSGNIAAYVISDGVQWEVGTGVVTSGSPDTLSRTTVIASSNSDNLVSWTNDNANERDVFCAPLAAHVHPITTRGDFLRGDVNGIVERQSLGASGTQMVSDGSDLVMAVPTGSFQSGTKALFQQSTAPTGWTKDTTHNNKALRLVSGSVGNGGATVFTSIFGSGKTSSSYTLLEADMPAHTHTGGGTSSGTHGSGGGTAENIVNTGSTGGDTGHSHGLPLDVQFVDVIIATKD